MKIATSRLKKKKIQAISALHIKIATFNLRSIVMERMKAATVTLSILLLSSSPSLFLSDARLHIQISKISEFKEAIKNEKCF